MSAIKFTIGFAIGGALRGLKTLKGALTNVGKAVRQTGQSIRGMSQRSKIDLMAWSAAFQELNNVASGMFRAMVENSPRLGAAMAELSMESDLLAMSLGEALAPVIEPLVEGLVILFEWIAALPEPFRLFIALVIALTVAVTALGIAIITVQTAGAPLIAIILAIIIVIAALITFVVWLWNSWEKISTWIKDNMKLFIGLIAILTLLFGPIVLVIAAIIGLVAMFKNWGKVTQWFGDLWAKFTEWLSNVWQKAVEKIMKLWDWLVGAFGKAKDFFGNVVSGIGNFLGSIVSGILNALISGINWFLGKIKGFFDSVREWDLVPNWLANKIPSISLIPSFQKGGIMPFTGLAFLHAGERVLNTKETDALQTLQMGNAIPTTGERNLSSQSVEINNDITLEGGIFTDSRQINDLAEVISEIILDKILRGVSI